MRCAVECKSRCARRDNSYFGFPGHNKGRLERAALFNMLLRKNRTLFVGNKDRSVTLGQIFIYVYIEKQEVLSSNSILT